MSGQSVKAPYAAEYVQRCVELNAKVGDGLAYVRLDCLRTLLAEREELLRRLNCPCAHCSHTADYCTGVLAEMPATRDSQ